MVAAYFKTIGSDWLARMTGPLSLILLFVPLAAPDLTTKYLGGSTLVWIVAFICLIVSTYRAWLLEHRSRLAAFVIDCKSSDVDAAAKFWGAALGRSVEQAGPDSGDYRNLAARENEPMLLVQKVDHESRIHLDIEADDLEAEVKRLEALGARRVKFLKRWWVMEAPTGQKFCVVNPQRGPLAGKGTEWK